MAACPSRIGAAPPFVAGAFVAGSLELLQAALAGRYQIERELGRGGMAVVYLADDLKHHRPVALKVLTPEIAAALGRDRFLCEIEIAARLVHPHILPLHDSGSAGEALYYVTPFIEGESLRTRLQREGRLSVDESVRLTREVASALGYAHQRKWVHRDVKPENILLSEGLALLADFGIARAVDGSNAVHFTRSGVVLGTPSYVSPEAIAGREVDARTDLYALGCVLHEMLAGEPPFSGATVESMLYQHLTAEPKAMTELRPDVPAGVAMVIARALAKSPDDRFATAALFAEALGLATTSPPGSGRGVPLTEDAIPTGLPKQLKRFVGRQRELADCSQRLGDARLLTLTGVGGCGKTRLALELAQSVRRDYPGGLWFVDLAPVAEGAQVAQVVAVALQLSRKAGTSVLDTISHHINGTRLLLLMDNCEHLLDAAASLAEDLLCSCDELRIVATSREGLGVEGEVRYAVPPMQTPPADAMRDLRLMEQADAVQLFVDRARRVSRGFELNEKTGPLVAEICRRLDGIPLAIELAAAKVEVLTVDQILARLDDRFRLLSGGSRALARHQTLRATIQWSFDHLTPEEQRLFRALSVFSGDWTLGAATAVVAEAADEFEVLDLLASLARKSLVRVEDELGSEAWYGMLETVREYAKERLEESDEGDATRARHLDFYLGRAEREERRVLGRDQREALLWFDRAREDLLSAMTWSERAPEGPQKALRLVNAMDRYMMMRGSLELALQRAERALAISRGDPVGTPRLRALLVAAHVAIDLRRSEVARDYLEQALPLARELGDGAGEAEALTLLGGMAHVLGDMPAAQDHMRNALTLARKAGARPRITAALTGLAEMLRSARDLAGAEPLYEESIELGRQMHDPDIISLNLINLSMVRAGQSRIPEACRLAREGLRLVEEIGGKDVRMALDVAAGLSASLGELEFGVRLFGGSEAELQRVSSRRDPADQGFIEPLIADARRTMGEEKYAASFAAGHASSYAQLVAEARAWLEAHSGT